MQLCRFWSSFLHCHFSLRNTEQICRPFCRNHVIKDFLVFCKLLKSMDAAFIKAVV